MTIPRKALPKPNYGRRLLPSLIDERAQRSHAQTYAAIPVNNDPKDGFREVSYGLFANAINRCASWLIENVGTTSSFDTLVYFGAQDLRYQILCIAACKTGHVVSCLSSKRRRRLTVPRCSSLHRETAWKLTCPYSKKQHRR